MLKKKATFNGRRKKLLFGIKTDVDRKKLIELEAQIKECDDQIATDETHVQEEEREIRHLKGELMKMNISLLKKSTLLMIIMAILV